MFFLPFLLLSAAFSASEDTLTPRQVVRRFDSLLDAGAEGEAATLCAGSALRMLPFLIEAQRKLSPFLDSAKSRDTISEEKCAGKWCALKTVSDAVFEKPLMGMKGIHSVQALHLFRKPGGWKLAEFEELPDEKAPLTLRLGEPSDSIAAAPSLFPVSRKAPKRRGADRLRFRVSLRNGDPLAWPEGENQRIIQRGKDWALLETGRAALPPSASYPAIGREKGNAAMDVFLGSNAYLDLEDSLLQAKAEELRQGAGDALEIFRRVYGFVSSSFRFRLGATLFGTSREALRGMQGDCSEAAVLAAALLRALGIPSRVALGFASTGRGVFIGHAWTEGYVGGRWIGLDAALREFPAGAERLALMHLDGSADMRVAAANLMLRALSNLEIEIASAWSGGKPLALYEQSGNAAEARAYFEEILRGMSE